MASPDRQILQNLISDNQAPRTLKVIAVPEQRIPKSVIDSFLMNVEHGVGLSPIYGKVCILKKLAICNGEEILIVTAAHFSDKATFAMISVRLLNDGTFRKYAFNLARLTTSLALDRKCTLVMAFDILSCGRESRHTLQAFKNVLGGRANDAMLRRFIALEEGDDTDEAQLATQAWAALHDSQIPLVVPALSGQVPVNTQRMAPQELLILANVQRNVDRLRMMKTPIQKNDIGDKHTNRGDTLVVQCARFKTRLRLAGNQHLMIEYKDSPRPVRATVAKVEGKQSRLKAASSSNPAAQIKAIRTFGRDDPTNAERSCADFILRCLSNTASLRNSSFIKAIWLPGLEGSSHANVFSECPVSQLPGRRLNASQERAVQGMLSSSPITIVQGPPGSGKTSIAAATVLSIIQHSDKRTVYLVAQSNVAVKNIAEKLGSVEFWDFKILVSKDFHFDWHEHLYEQIERNLIRGDQFGKTRLLVERQLAGSRVILCTLSMLSHPAVDSLFARIVPVETLVVDEASQINIGDFLSVFNTFRKTLEKVVFIGDDKQLAPHGAEDIKTLQSIFEKKHLRKKAFFLDTQCEPCLINVDGEPTKTFYVDRMPTVIGCFISAAMYGGKLATVHKDQSRKPCRFVDVPGGMEKFKDGAYTNQEEARIVISLAKRYVRLGWSFRIVTPYDGQRNYIENQLKAAGVPWENTVFNVDSFQGNEDDHIILSPVRTQRPGFLTNCRRSNVMLSRCKKSMVICTSKSFLEREDIKQTLLGKLAAQMGSEAWVRKEKILAGTWDYTQPL